MAGTGWRALVCLAQLCEGNSVFSRVHDVFQVGNISNHRFMPMIKGLFGLTYLGDMGAEICVCLVMVQEGVCFMECGSVVVIQGGW
nr:hypothetical protein [Tanacetum cinerariifolium]GFC32549.1 hypothetical protein [Tanacetum cinerariifolium]